jgi:hypothetical protein
MTLTKEEKELLTQIVNDRYSIGAFSGMVFNKVADKVTNYSDEDYIKLALSIRLKCQEMIK